MQPDDQSVDVEKRKTQQQAVIGLPRPCRQQRRDSGHDVVVREHSAFAAPCGAGCVHDLGEVICRSRPGESDCLGHLSTG